MTWILGHADDSTSYTFSADKRDLDHSPIDVTVDGFNPEKPHVTVLFGDECIVSSMDSIDETGSGQCVFTITSEHAEMMVILPIHLATLLVGFEAAHREMLEQPPVAPVVPGRDDIDIAKDLMQQLSDSVDNARRKRRLSVIRDTQIP